MKAFWIYTGLRIGLFVAAFALVAGVWALVTGDRANPIAVLFIAAVLSAAASWRLLAGPRERLATNVHERAARASTRFEEMRAAEDED